jgi:MMP alpha-(1->4)-mannosyltransferase
VIHDGVDGVLVPPGDSHALAVAVGRILGDAALADRLRASGHRRARDFGWDAVVPSVEAIYARAIEGRSGGLG